MAIPIVTFTRGDATKSAVDLEFLEGKVCGQVLDDHLASTEFLMLVVGARTKDDTSKAASEITSAVSKKEVGIDGIAVIFAVLVGISILRSASLCRSRRR